MAAEKPNILLIVADDLGWSDVGWHGGFGKTPVMDKLVKEGVELDQHYVQPVCTPTRTALMSGRYPGRFGPQAIAKREERCLRLGDWKLIQPAKKGALELYNIATDPFEKTDLAASETAKLEELRQRLEGERAKDNPTLPADLEGGASLMRQMLRKKVCMKRRIQCSGCHH